MISFPSIINEFIITTQTTKNISSKTIVAYRSDLNDFNSFLSQNTLDEQIVLKYVNYLSNIKHLKDSTIKRKLVVLKLFFEFLTKHNYIEKNYYEIHSFRFRQEKRLPKILTPQEVQKLLSYVQNQVDKATSEYGEWKAARDLALIDILISTGIRIAEASNISQNDIISAEHVILIHGKGRKQRMIYISCQQTWTNLLKWLKIRKTKPTQSDMVFVNRFGEQLGIHGIEYIFNRIKSSAGINPQATPPLLATHICNLSSNQWS